MDIEETRNAYERAYEIICENQTHEGLIWKSNKGAPCPICKPETPQTFTAKVCACGEPMQPELLNITMFNDTLPRWTIGWLCPYYLHTNHIKRTKDNTDG